MSYNHPYRNPPDDFSTNNYKFKISQQIHPRDSNAYISRIRNTSSEQTSLSSSEMSIFPPGKALSFLHSCGLDTEDLKTLAELPEHLITADALPDLLAEIKKKKISRMTSSRSSALQASTSTRSWDDRSHTQSVEYPLDLPVRQPYSLNREQVPTWDDRWGNVQQTSSQTRTYTSSEPNYIVEYNHLKDKKSHFDNPSSYATEPSRQKTSVVPQSYGNYSRNVSQSSNFSSRDISQSSHRSGRDASQSSHLSSRDFSQSSHLSSRDVGLPSLLSSRDVGPPSILSSRGIGSHSLMSRRDIVPPSNLSSRDIGPPLFLSSRDIGLPSLLSIRDLAPPSRLSSRDASQSSHQRRKPVIHIVPTRKEASDFHGKTPPVFPYACVLCEITVLSNKDWSVHVKGPQHANSQLSLVEKYPEWDQTIQSARRNEPGSESSKSRTTQERGGASSNRNGSSGSKIRASGSKSESSSSKNLNQTQATTKCKVVCVKFEVDEVDEAYLKKVLGQFGAIVKIIMFPKLAFVEMGTAGQAEDIVKYFLRNPLWIRGEMIQFSLSAAFSFLQSSLVVSFSPLPSGDGIRSELMAIAKRFGSVKHSLFLPSRGYVEMASVEEANKLVEHYSTNSLKLKGKTINVCFSAEYQSLSDVDKEKSPVPYGSRRRRNSSPKSRSRSSRIHSPSPKRRASENREESRRSREKTKESSRRDSSSKSQSKISSPSKDQKTKTEESVEEMFEEDQNQSDIMGDDSDLEGVAVIADDGEELNSEDEFTVDDELDDEGYEIVDALTEQDKLEDVQTVKESNDQTKPSDMDTLKVQSETSECVPAATTSDRSSDCREAQELQQAEQEELQRGEQKELQQGEQEELQQREQKELQQGEQKENQQGEQKELQQGEQKQLQQGEQKELQQGEQKELQQGEQKELQRGEQKELQQGEQKKLQQGEQKELQQGEQKELQQGEQKELQQGEQEELKQGEQKDETEEKEEEEKATDFPGNLENLPTSDKFKEEVLTEQGDEMEISASITEEKYGKVLEVGGFPVAKKYTEKDLLKIGEKYGDVADCCLVRSNRKVEKALIEMVDADAAAKLEAESKRQRIRLGGKILKITMSKTYSQVNKGVDSGQEHAEDKNEEPSCSLVSSEESTVVMAETETSEEAAEAQKETNTDAIMQMSSDEEEVYGRVLRIRNLPMPDEYTDADFLSIAEPYGKVKRHWMFRLHRTGLIEMEKACDAEKVVSAANMNKITVAGNHPKVSVSTKHAHLNKRYFLHGPSDGSIQTSTELEKEFWSDNQDVDSKEDEKQVSEVDGGNGMEVENSDSVSKAITQTMDPVGTEFVRPVVGYFCSLCNAIYASEEEAKNDHCRTPLHHQKLKEHKERNSS